MTRKQLKETKERLVTEQKNKPKPLDVRPGVIHKVGDKVADRKPKDVKPVEKIQIPQQQPFFPARIKHPGEPGMNHFGYGKDVIHDGNN